MLVQHETDRPIDGHVYYVHDGPDLRPVMYSARHRKYMPVAWTAQPGSQDAFLECDHFEVLYEGTRGPGKTDALLMDFAQHVGAGFGSDWNGILFRRTYPELGDVIAKSLKWFSQIFGKGARYNASDHSWRFHDGETLKFRHMKKPDDYWSYHGHAYCWQGWEELCTWPNDQCYKRMFSCARTTNPKVPIRIRSTANPYGIGHNWVKKRWNLPVLANRLYGEVQRFTLPGAESEIARVAIHGELAENKLLLHADPSYVSRLRESARNEQELRAWLFGDWNIVAGGMFDDVWSPSHHILPDFDLTRIPKTWRIDRSYDHGQSKPFSVGWWAESNGEPIEVEGQWIGKVNGDLIRISEWYGWDGKRDNEGLRLTSPEIARGIVQHEKEMGIHSRVKAGAADSSIFDNYEGNKSVAGDMRRFGVRWEPIDKGPGSRKQGWEQMRKMLRAAIPIEGIREEPGLFILENCKQFQRTVPVLPRSDRDLDDVDTEAEDHIGDEVRYRLRIKRRVSKIFRWK